MIDNEFRSSETGAPRLTCRVVASAKTEARHVDSVHVHTKREKQMKTPLCSYTHLAFLINGIIDERPANELTFKEIHDAAHDGRLLALLAERCGNAADFGLLVHSSIINLEQMEAALSDEI